MIQSGILAVSEADMSFTREVEVTPEDYRISVCVDDVTHPTNTSLFIDVID